MPESGSVFAASAWFAMLTGVRKGKRKAEKKKKGAGVKFALLPLQKFRLARFLVSIGPCPTTATAG
jgi:hypothetical protein